MSKKYVTTILIETTYDPSLLGTAQLVLDAMHGESVIISKETVEVLPEASESDIVTHKEEVK